MSDRRGRRLATPFGATAAVRLATIAIAVGFSLFRGHAYHARYMQQRKEAEMTFSHAYRRSGADNSTTITTPRTAPITNHQQGQQQWEEAPKEPARTAKQTSNDKNDNNNNDKNDSGDGDGDEDNNNSNNNNNNENNNGDKSRDDKPHSDDAKASAAIESQQQQEDEAGEMHTPIDPAAGADFKRYDRVAIVTKTNGNKEGELKELEQSLCLLHHAYNHKVLYDVVVFTTHDLPGNPAFADRIRHLQAMVAPANLTVVHDNRGLQEEIAAQTPAARDLLLRRCNATDVRNLTWDHKCPDDPADLVEWERRRELERKKGGPPLPKIRKGLTTLGYNWQAQFRSINIWTHPALAPYRTMLWMDTDGFATRPWLVDPVEYFIENKGVVFFDHFPKGSARMVRPQSIQSAFNNHSVCSLTLNRITGELEAVLDQPRCWNNFRVPTIHGFFHITDLDFYRQPSVLDGLTRLQGDCFLCRNPDDQLAVTLPAALFAPHRSWEMSLKGFDLKIFHNFDMDGKVRLKPPLGPGFRRHWGVVRANFTAADANCVVTQAGR